MDSRKASRQGIASHVDTIAGRERPSGDARCPVLTPDSVSRVGMNDRYSKIVWPSFSRLCLSSSGHVLQSHLFQSSRLVPCGSCLCRRACWAISIPRVPDGISLMGCFSAVSEFSRLAGSLPSHLHLSVGTFKILSVPPSYLVQGLLRLLLSYALSLGPLPEQL